MRSLKLIAAAAAGAALLLSAAAHAADTIKIGFSTSLTGGLASSGKANLLAQQIWQEKVNAAGGLLGRQVDLVYYDDQSKADTVPGIYAKLLDVDKVDLLMGAATNLIVAAMPEIMQHQKMVVVLLALGSNDEFKYPRYFQTGAWGPDTKGVISNAFFEVAKGISPRPKTVAIVGADADFSNNAMTGARANAKKDGLNIVYDRTYPPGTTDYTPIVRAIQAANPDLVFVASYPLELRRHRACGDRTRPQGADVRRRHGRPAIRDLSPAAFGEARSRRELSPLCAGPDDELSRH